MGSTETTRRGFLKSSLAAGGALWLTAILPPEAFAAEGVQPTFELPPLPYPFDALEPHIDAETMRIHHDLHHAGYVKGLNAALKALADGRASGALIPADVQGLSRQIAFHGGGHYNHSVFWEGMAPAGNGGGGEPSGNLAERIVEDFGSAEAFRAHFGAAAKAIEGSGWAVLGWHDGLNRLVVLTMLNQQDLTILGTEPILMLDVWEHAYYLKYQNKRAAYVDAWWNVVNWTTAAARFKGAIDHRAVTK